MDQSAENLAITSAVASPITRSPVSLVSTMNESPLRTPASASSRSLFPNSPQLEPSRQELFEARIELLLSIQEKRDADQAILNAEHATREAEQAMRDAKQAKRDIAQAIRDSEQLKRDEEMGKKVAEYEGAAISSAVALAKIQEEMRIISNNSINEREMLEAAIQLHSNCDAKFTTMEATIAASATKIATVELNEARAREALEEVSGALTDLNTWTTSQVYRFPVSSQTYYTDGN